MNNMINARKLGIGKLALLVLGAAVGGCTEEEAIFGRAAMAGVSSHPRVVANPKASAWAGAFSAGSQAQLNSINAGKMGTTVNVNVNGNSSQEYYQGHPVHYWNEKNKTGSAYIINDSGEVVYISKKLINKE